MSNKKIRIGYNPSSLFSTKDIVRFAKLSDGVLQADSIWIPESWGREAFTMLGTISQVTNRIKLGTSVVNIYARSPATTAMAAFTLDDLAPGRIIIGLGAGTPALAENWHGIEFLHPLRRLEEFTECFRCILTGKKVNYEGVFYNIRDFSIMYRSKGKNIPIFFGAVNKRMIKLATNISDGVILYLRPLEEIREVVNMIKSLVQRSDRNFEICCVFITAICDQNPELARLRASKTLAFYISVGEYYSKFLSDTGFNKEVMLVKEVYAKEGLDKAADCIPDKMLRSLTIFGNTEDCLKSLREIVSTGISLPILQVNPVRDTGDSIKQSLLLATLV
jgi:5,10-methylenetetrahydromethanopterin reductase